MSFHGYLRENGTYGVRNHVAVISSVICINGVVEEIARQVPGVLPLTHAHGCGSTGEITLRGRVLPIGGLKEKLLAALRANIPNIIIPRDNEKDLSEIPAEITKKLSFYLVDNMDKVLELAIWQQSIANDSDSSDQLPVNND